MTERSGGEARQAAERLLQLRRGNSLGRLDWKTLRDEGRR